MFKSTKPSILGGTRSVNTMFDDLPPMYCDTLSDEAQRTSASQSYWLEVTAVSAGHLAMVVAGIAADLETRVKVGQHSDLLSKVGACSSAIMFDLESKLRFTDDAMDNLAQFHAAIDSNVQFLVEATRAGNESLIAQTSIIIIENMLQFERINSGLIRDREDFIEINVYMENREKLKGLRDINKENVIYKYYEYFCQNARKMRRIHEEDFQRHFARESPTFDELVTLLNSLHRCIRLLNELSIELKAI